MAVWLLILAALVPSTASASANEESAFIAQVNQARAAQGLPALKPDVQLTNLARSWAAAMRDGTCGADKHICHASPISAGVTHAWQKLGENVGTGPDVGSVMSAFIASPGHYANIMDPEFTHIGVGVVWEGNRMYTTHRFMKLQTAPPTTTTVAPTTTTAAPVATTAAPVATTTPTAPTTTTAASSPATTQPVATNQPDTTAPDVGTPDDSGLLSANDEQPRSTSGQTRPPLEVREERAEIFVEAFIDVLASIE